MATSQPRIIKNLKSFKRQPLQKVLKKDQSIFLKTLYELLLEGFSMQQALIFMEILLPKYKNVIDILTEQLSQGYGIEKGLRQVGYSLSIVAQLYYGQKQGRFLESLNKNIQQIELMTDYKKRLVKTISYPIVMFFFLVALLLGMRTFLLPHIVSFISQDVYDNNVMIQLLVKFFSFLPQILVGLFGGGLCVYLFVDLYLLKQTYMKRAIYLSRFPLLKKWTRWFYTFKLAQTLGYFLEGGYSLKQTVEFIVKYPIDPFLAEIANEINQTLMQGFELVEGIESLKIFQLELGLVIHQGELTSQVATKCLMYSEKLLFNLMEDIAKKISYIQPIIFILIAVLVMSMYLLMMLPMLTMDGF